MKLTTKHNHIIDFDYIPFNPVIVDAGSKDASIFEEFSKYIDTNILNFYVIEADPQHIQNINHKLVYNCVLCGDSSPDEIEFYSYGNVGWGSIFWSDRRNKSWRHSGTHTVPTIKINDIFKVLNINSIDYLKLDVEGTEFDLFKTMSQDTANKIKQISCEVHEEFMPNGKDFIKSRLFDLGFDDIVEYDFDEIWCVR